MRGARAFFVLNQHFLLVPSYFTLHSLIMSAPQDAYAREIESIVYTLADWLNVEHKTLAKRLTGDFKALFADICSEGRSAHDSTIAVAGTAQTIMPRRSFQTLLSALKQFPHTNNSSSVVVDGVYHLRQFSIRPDHPNSIFHNGKAVISHDALIHILDAIWRHPSVTEKVFKQAVSGTCAYVPPHIISRFLLLVMPWRRIRQPPVSKAEKAVIGRSSFGHCVMGESYLRLMIPLIPAAPDFAKMDFPPSLHATPDVTVRSLSEPPSASASANTVSPSADSSTSLPFGLPLCIIKAYLMDRISTTLRTILPGGGSQSSTSPSSSLPGASAFMEKVAAMHVEAEQRESRKRKFWSDFELDVSLKRRKVNDWTSRSLWGEDEAPALRKNSAGLSEAGSAQGMTAQRPMVKLRKARYRTCPVPWF